MYTIIRSLRHVSNREEEKVRLKKILVKDHRKQTFFFVRGLNLDIRKFMSTKVNGKIMEINVNLEIEKCTSQEPEKSRLWDLKVETLYYINRCFGSD